MMSSTDGYHLCTEIKVPPSDIILSGDSAGGGIVVQLAMFLRDQGFSEVGGMMLLSPWLDLTTSFESWHENRVSLVPREVEVQRQARD